MLRDKYVDKLCDLIRIPSVYDENSVEGGPFGRKVKECLEEILSFGRSEGFNTKNYDGFAGELTVGEGDYIIGILGHVDVVAAGEGWETDPFTPVIKEGKLYGRGSLDDKGPLMAAMSAAERLKSDNKIPTNAAIRIIIGTNEEESWGGINYYIENASRLPDISIVPDGNFPIIYCEKGLYDCDITYTKLPNSEAPIQLISIGGGDGRNMVASDCRAVLYSTTKNLSECVRHITTYAETKNYKCDTVITNKSELTVIMQGVSTHGSMPESGKNAISYMMDVLNTCFSTDFSHYNFVRGYMDRIGTKYNGELAGIDFEDAMSGKLTFNVGTLKVNPDSTITIGCNLRHPASSDIDEIKSIMRKSFAERDFVVSDVDYLNPVYFNKEDPVVCKLVNVYREVTGDMESEPMAIGGATYARAIPNALSYGAVFPGDEDISHMANEFITLKNLDEAEEIYYKALDTLLKESGKS